MPAAGGRIGEQRAADGAAVADGRVADVWQGQSVSGATRAISAERSACA
jgi:hypothetical protein